MSSYNNGNAFQSSSKRGSQAQKGFLQTHGMAMGGGVLALGMMIVGSQYLQDTNLSADLTDEAEMVTEATVTATPTAEPVVTEATVAEATEEPEAEEAVVSEEETATSTEEEEKTETEEESPSAVSDTEVTTVSTTSTTTVVTNPIVDTRPLYADPVEGETQELATPEPTPVRAPAALLDKVPVPPAVPEAIKRATPPAEGMIESQEARDLNPAIPE